jgi:hypothetical protein
VRLVDGDQAVGPLGVPAGGRRGDGGGDEGRLLLGQGPDAGAVDGDQAVVADLLAGQQGADDVDALAQPGVASSLRGQTCPVTCSFIASPEPRATQKRPGNIAPRVAIAWATITGWYRWPGALTAPKGRPVVARAAPSQDQAKPEWPCRSFHGSRWSEHMAAVKPTSSACCTARSSSAGCTCSWELWNPITVMPGPYPAVAPPTCGVSTRRHR